MNEILFFNAVNSGFLLQNKLTGLWTVKTDFFSQARVLLVHYSKKVQSLILLVV